MTTRTLVCILHRDLPADELACPCYTAAIAEDIRTTWSKIDAPPAVDPLELDRDTTIARIRAALRRRSGRAWSVTGGRGTAWGWIRISSPPARRVDYGYMSDADRAELGALLGLDGPVHPQGESIPSGSDYYSEYIDRAEGRPPSRTGTPYWD